MNGSDFYQHVANAERLPDVVSLMAELQRERHRRIQAEQENGFLRKQLASKERKSKIVGMALRDAAELLLRRTTGYAISRDAMMREGMSFRRWTWAIAALRYCQIISVRGRRFSLKWFSDDHNELFEMFEQGKTRLDKAPKALESLRQCLPDSIKRQ